ncbi:hypothetical protein KCP76_19795 [Salmonella enterica subsp. enterica serovar Weltevreden]|nr:hypothetical protein KCP76_19795 [Salmonella enterica subsp. enterica serovar Weltevreden]
MILLILKMKAAPPRFSVSERGQLMATLNQTKVPLLKVACAAITAVNAYAPHSLHYYFVAQDIHERAVFSHISIPDAARLFSP